MSHESQEASSPDPSRNGVRRRARRNTYATQACERCRVRKQRCRWDENAASEGNAICQNCRDSGKECLLAQRDESAKRARLSQSHDERGRSAITSTSPDGSPAEPSQSRPSGSWGFTSDSFSIMPGTTMGNSTGVGEIAFPDAQQDPEVDWSSWLPPQTEDLDFNSLHSLSGQMRGQERSNPFIQQASNYQTAPSVNMTATNQDSSLRGASPGVRTRREIATGMAMVTLEAAAEPHYVGESSGSFWSDVITQGMKEPRGTSRGRRQTNKRPRNRSPSPTDRHILRASLQRQLSNEVARHILLTVYQHLHSRYPFLDWVTFDRHWQAREGLLLAIAIDRRLNEEASIAAFFVLMVLAIGAHLCKNDQLAGVLRPEEYHALAQPFLPVIVQLHNLVNVQGLLLLAMYSLRDSRGPSVWFISGVTMRLCVSLGLHRGVASVQGRATDVYQSELRKRIFWTCYVLDRMMSMTLGRPPGISDDDIDVSLPNVLVEPLNLPLPEMRAQSMVSAVHYIGLKRLESQIQRTFYTVAGRDRVQAQASSQPLLMLLDQWEADIPAEASNPNRDGFPCCSKDWFQLRGIEARLHLLRPMCAGSGEASREHLVLLAKNAAKGCELQKKTHQYGQPTSSTSVHSTFICGLALLYALFRNPSILPLREVFLAVKAASATLFAYSQSDTSSAALHDVFEELSSACMDKIGAYGAETSPSLHAAPKDWQAASAQATSSLETAEDYTSFLKELGLGGNDGLSAPTNPFADSLWDLAMFSPAVATPNML